MHRNAVHIKPRGDLLELVIAKLASCIRESTSKLKELLNFIAKFDGKIQIWKTDAFFCCAM